MLHPQRDKQGTILTAKIPDAGHMGVLFGINPIKSLQLKKPKIAQMKNLNSNLIVEFTVSIPLLNRINFKYFIQKQTK